MKTHPALKGTPPFSPLEGSAKGEKPVSSPLSPEGLCPPRGMREGISRAKYIVLPIEGERSEGQRGSYNY